VDPDGHPHGTCYSVDDLLDAALRRLRDGGRVTGSWRIACLPTEIPTRDIKTAASSGW
jgi:hypothetical protein